MKPYGKSFSRDGCTCSLCRSRGYRKGNAYDSEMRACKKTERQRAKKLVVADLESYGGRQGTLSTVQSLIQSEHAEAVAYDWLKTIKDRHPGAVVVFQDEIVINADFTGIETRALDVMKAPYWWKEGEK